MTLLSWAKKKIQRMGIWEFALVKIALIIFGIIIGAYISTFVKQYIWWFVVIFVVLYAILFYSILKKK